MLQRSRRSILCLTSIILAFMIPAVPAWASEPQIKTQKINDSLYVLYGGQGQGAHVGVSVGEDGVLLVDSMHAASNQKLLEAIRKITDKPIRYVINTHQDSDHSGGNKFFSSMGATVISHMNFKYTSVPSDMKVGEDFSMSFNGDDISLHPIWAHSSGDIVVRFSNSNVLFLGDIFTNTWHPTAIRRGLESELEASDLALSLCDTGTKIVPGHGLIDKCEALNENKRRAHLWFDRVGQLSALGQNAAQIMSDPEVSKLRALFAQRRNPPVIADRGFKRFVERTLSVDFVSAIPLNADQLRRYEGKYTLENGDMINIALEDGYLVARRLNSFIEQLVPVSKDKFHIRFSLAGMYRFKSNEAGYVQRLVGTRGDQVLRAERVQE